MKTAISIPDKVFREAERAAKRLGVSRSQLYVRALERYLSDQSRRELTERMNQVCKKLDTTLDPGFTKAQSRAIGPEEW